MSLRAHGGGLIFAEHNDGRRPVILGLHGWGRNRSDLAGLLRSTGHQSMSLDLPGFGASPAPHSAWGANEYASAIAEHVLAGGAHEPVVVIGHSFGGRVAVCLAAQHPEMVSGLVLMGVPLMRPPTSARPSLRYRVTRSAARLGLLSSQRLEAARQRHGSQDYRLAQGTMRDVLVRVVNEDYRAELRAIDCPVALIWGANDADTPFSVAEAAAALIRDLKALTALDDAGHDVHKDASDEVAGLVASVLKDCR